MPRMPSVQNDLAILQQRVVACTRCERLVKYCLKVARERKRMYRDWEYWGKPIPSFGDPQAELLILGLAPAAHGGNRTGRIFTGDRSGDFLYRSLYEAGFANQPESRQRGDGLKLNNCYITAALRCAPPANKPLPEELLNCQPYLEAELRLLKRVRAVLALGRIAFDTYLRLALRPAEPRLTSPRRATPTDHAAGGAEEQQKSLPRSSFRFAHGANYEIPGRSPRLFASYHPSQQNTQTGRLTPEMMRPVFEDIRRFLFTSGDLTPSPLTFRR
jgi:uracil-DNA glycosylase